MTDHIKEEAFVPLGKMIAGLVQKQPERIALVDERETLSYAEMGQALGGVAACMKDAGLAKGDVLAIGGLNCVEYVLAYLAAAISGIVVVPLPISSTADSLAKMVRDCQAKMLLADPDVVVGVATDTGVVTDAGAVTGAGSIDRRPLVPTIKKWRQRSAAIPQVPIAPDDIFNIIYSSGTTGTPKGIVQSHALRFAHVRLGLNEGYDNETINLLSTPLYSNTTLVSFFPTIALGGTVVLMAKFDCQKFLSLAEQHRVTHTMLVPVQYRRLMDFDEFDQYDLSAFRHKYCTSAPFSVQLKQEILDRWPGGLTEYYGMTEGGGACVLRVHEHPDKLQTVGRPAEGASFRIIDEQDNQITPTELGEIVGYSPSMMPGYLNRPDLNSEIFWTDKTGKKFIRSGDIGRFDEDGFLYLTDRKKEVIISGGFNIYPADIEQVLTKFPEVLDAAVVGVPSHKWGETPVAFVRAPGSDALKIMQKVNSKVGKFQRVAQVVLVDSFPRSSIGKVLKRELRDTFLRKSEELTNKKLVNKELDHEKQARKRRADKELVEVESDTTGKSRGEK